MQAQLHMQVTCPKRLAMIYLNGLDLKVTDAYDALQTQVSASAAEVTSRELLVKMVIS